MEKRKTIAIIVSALALTITGCGGKKKAETKEEEKFDPAMLSSEKVDDLSQWKGEWESFSEYCEDEDLQPVWEKITGKMEIDTDELKDVFRRICFVPDDVVKFDISEKTVKGYDTEDKEVFSHDYEYAATFSKDSDGTVLNNDVTYVFMTNDKDAGFYKYICLMPLCTMESSKGYIADHFHFSYGDSIERLTNFSNVPTMFTSDITEEEKLQSIITFFSATDN